MFFIIFIICILNLISKTNTAENSLECLSGGNQAFDDYCTFSLQFNESFPDDKTIIEKTNCKRNIVNNYSKKRIFCFASISIYYDTRMAQISFQISHESKIQPLSVCDKTLCVLGVTQYKLKVEWQRNSMFMPVHIYCMNADNCAVKKLRNLFSDLISTTSIPSDTSSFAELLNEPKPAAGSKLK
jgi:hypothetical protein